MMSSRELARFETATRRQDPAERLLGETRTNHQILALLPCQIRLESDTRQSNNTVEDTISPVMALDALRPYPFIGVRISCDMLAKNSDLDLLASSAASLAIVFFCRLSRSEKTIRLIFVLSESISPEASTVTNEEKSPSVAAADICANART